MKTYEYTAPACWAPYLINGDPSGLIYEDIEAADKWIESIGLGAPVGCEDAGFVHYHDAFEFMALASDCETYTFLEH